MAGPLLSTKFFVPHPRTSTLDRPRVSALLDRVATARLTVVSAQAGFGKTVAMANWVHQGPGPEDVAWLSLEQTDADPETFWTYVVNALARRVPDVGDSVLPLLAPGQRPSPTALTELLNRLAETPHEVYLVLDDYHLVDNPGIAAGMEFFVSNLPPQSHVVLSTRADPNLPLARLRARGEVVEVRASDLRFTSAEAADYLHHAGLDLTSSGLATLQERTEGWAAALQLVALSAQNRDDVDRFIADFAGDDRFIVDYLVEEVLARQPQAVHDFLVRTSVLDRLTGPLCDAVTGQSDGDLTLEALDRNNLFVIPLDARRRWYRYHHLFADVLRTHLRTTRGEVSVAELHRRASHWYAQNDDVVAAISHALAADDHAGAAALMEVAIPDLLRERRESTVVSWIDAVPDDVVQARPVLAMGFVAALMSRNDFDRVPARLRDLEPFLSDAPSGAAEAPTQPVPVLAEDPSQLGRLAGRAELYRAGLALLAGDVEATHHHVSRVAEVCDPGDLATRAGAFGLSGLAHWSMGDLEDAHQCYTSCVDVLLRAGHVSDVLGCSIALADLRITQGRLRDARATYEKALALAASGHDVVRGTPDMHIGLSALHLERNDLLAAEGHLRRAQELGEKSGLPQHPYRLRVAMAQLRHAHGDDEEALGLLEEAERVYLADFSPNVRPVHATRARLLIALGRLGQAHAWAAEHHLTSLDQLTYVREYEHVTLALLLLAEHRASRSAASTARALQLLGRLQRDAEAGGRAGTLIEILVLTSLASWAHGNQDDAVSQLERAVALGEPEGYVRVFTQHATELLPVLNLLPAPVADGTYLQTLLRAARTAAADAPAVSNNSGVARQPLVDPLSRRELEVLALLATDLTGPELARHLVVSLNTLRTHTRNVYAKLGVSGRRAAVSRARELDLLGRRGGTDRLTAPP